MTVVFFVFHPWSLILTQTPTVIGIGGGGEGGGGGWKEMTIAETRGQNIFAIEGLK